MLFELPDQEVILHQLEADNRELTNPFRHFYGIQKAKKIHLLLSDHLRLAVSLLQARQKLRVTDASRLRGQWAKNAQELAHSLALLNPLWEEEEWRQRLFAQMKTWEQAFEEKSEGNWHREAALFDEWEARALTMADSLASGLIHQFIMV